jgi:hypothetical protein
MKKERYNLIIGALIICLVSLSVILILLDRDKIPKLSPAERELQEFQKCVNDSGLILYGRYNSQVFLAQKESLGDYFDLIPFIDCVNQRRECEGILLIPAWKLNEQVYYGSFSKDVLIKLMGCE